MARAKRFKTSTFYGYLEASNSIFAKTQGRLKYGNASNYINYLIAKDRGDKASMKRTMEAAKTMIEPTEIRARKSKKAKKVSKKKLAKKASKKYSKPRNKIKTMKKVSAPAPTPHTSLVEQAA